jgi:hypothetical protein
MSGKLSITPKEFGALIGRSAEWVCERIGLGEIPTLPPHQRPYMIPGDAPEKFTARARCKKRRAEHARR